MSFSDTIYLFSSGIPGWVFYVGLVVGFLIGASLGVIGSVQSARSFGWHEGFYGKWQNLQRVLLLTEGVLGVLIPLVWLVLGTLAGVLVAMTMYVFWLPILLLAGSITAIIYAVKFWLKRRNR